MSTQYVQYPQGGSGGGVTGSVTGVPYSVGPIDSAPANPQGGFIGSQSFYQQSATATFPGLVSSAAQTFSGVKTFNAAPIMSSLSANQTMITGSNSAVSTMIFTSGNTGTTIVARDANGNSSFNNVNGTTTTSGATGSVTMTGGSARIQKTIGSASIAFNLPDATTLVSGWAFEFNNNSINNVIVNDNGANFQANVAPGAYGYVTLTNNATTNGVWDFHWLAPTSAIFGTSGLQVTGSVTVSSLGLSGPVRSDGSRSLVSGSISLVTDVTGSLSASRIGPTVPSGVGALDGANASPNAAVIGSTLLYMQSATNANPGIISSAAQNFSGVKSFERVGLNNVSGSSTLWVSVSSASLTDPGLTIKQTASQTGDLFQIFDSANSPQAIFDSGGNFKFFHNTLNTSRFDLRPSINTSTINSGTAARYTMFVSQAGTQAAGVGGGVAFGGPNNVGTNTTYGAIWVTKDNGTAGDVAASMHLATKNNSTGNFQRAIDIDAGGNTTFAGTVALTGSVASKITIGMPASNTPYNLVLPVSQGSNSWVLQNDGSGNLSWASALTNPMTTSGDIIVASSTGIATRLAGPTTSSTSVLISTGSGGAATPPTWSVYSPPTLTTLTNGSGSYTTPTNVKYLVVEVIGAGGGGGGSGTTTSGGDASAGTFSSFGSGSANAGLKANGGNGGLGGRSPAVVGGNGGTATSIASFSFCVSGQAGGGGNQTSISTINILGGDGGSTAVGGLGGRGSASSTAGSGQFPGGGGGGSGNGANANCFSGSGGGAGGYVRAIVVPTPGQVFAWTVGSASAGGGAGTSGGAGGNGADGKIYIWEHYF